MAFFIYDDEQLFWQPKKQKFVAFADAHAYKTRAMCVKGLNSLRSKYPEMSTRDLNITSKDRD